MKKVLLTLLTAIASYSATVLEVADFSTLKTSINPLTAGQQTVVVRSRATELDGGGGIFKWVEPNSIAEDLGTVLTSSLSSTGRWHRVYSGPLDIRWFGATADDSSDDTDAFNLIAGRNKDVSILIPPGTFICNNTLFSNSVTIKGSAVSIVQRTTDVPVFRFISTGIVRIDNLEIDGNGKNGNGISTDLLEEFSCDRLIVRRCGSLGNANEYSGLAIARASRVNVNNSQFYDCERDGFFSWGSTDVTVTSSLAQRCGRGGFVADLYYVETPGVSTNSAGPERVTMRGNSALQCGAIGLYAESLSTNTCTVDFSGNEIVDSGYTNWFPMCWGIAAGNSTYGTIHDNIIRGHGQRIVVPTDEAATNTPAAILSTGAKGAVAIHNNIIENYTWTGDTNFLKKGIVVSGTGYGLKVHNNDLAKIEGQGIYVYNTPYASITGNRVYSAAREGLYLTTCNGSAISANAIQSCSSAHSLTVVYTNTFFSGMSLNSSFQLDVTGNSVNGTDHAYGIQVSGSSVIRSLGYNSIQLYRTNWFGDTASLNLGVNTTTGNIDNLVYSLFGSVTDPNTKVTAIPGSTYRCTGGGTSTTLWVKESGSGDTGWVAK